MELQNFMVSTDAYVEIMISILGGGDIRIEQHKILGEWAAGRMWGIASYLKQYVPDRSGFEKEGGAFDVDMKAILADMKAILADEKDNVSDRIDSILDRKAVDGSIEDRVDMELYKPSISLEKAVFDLKREFYRRYLEYHEKNRVYGCLTVNEFNKAWLWWNLLNCVDYIVVKL